MSRFEGLLERLERDLETVHGARCPIMWVFSPDKPQAERWTCVVHAPTGQHLQIGHDGETTLLRHVDDYAARAHLVRERSA